MTRKAKIRMGYWGVGALAIVIASLFAINSCTQEPVFPEDSQERTIECRCSLIDPVTNECGSDPATPATLELFRINDDGTETSVDVVAADAQGKATFVWNSPSIGVRYYVAGEYNNRFVSTPIKFLCSDTTVRLCFEPTPPPPATCEDLPSGSVDILFTDQNGSDQLAQNSPAGLNYYEATTSTLFINENDDGLCIRVNVGAPNPNPPFSYSHALVSGSIVNGNPIEVDPGESIRLVYRVATTDIGDFTGTSDISYECCDNSTNSTGTVNLEAHVVERTCQCPDTNSYVFTIPEPIEIGDSETYQVGPVFTNNFDCGDATIDNITILNNYGEWTITAPNLPTTVAEGNDLYLTAEFEPDYALSRTERLLIEFTLSNGQTCEKYVELRGEGCLPLCPEISKVNNPRYPQDFVQFDEVNMIQDSLRFDFGEYRVPFSPNENCNLDPVEVDKEYTLYFADSSCCEPPINVNIAVRDTEAVQISSRYFEVVPDNRILLGEETQTALTVRFNSPTIEDFEDMLNSGDRPETGGVADSTFTIFIDLSTPNCNDCRQTIKIKAVVTTDARISPIRNLRAYNQETDLKPNPEAEVCAIDYYIQGESNEPGIVYTLRDPVDLSFPRPPDAGDFYIDVADPTPDFGTPRTSKPPRLRLGPGYEDHCIYGKIKRLTTGYPEEDFDNFSIVSVLQSTYDGNPNYFTSPGLPDPVTGLQGGDVYVIYSDTYWGFNNDDVPCCIALIYIRETKDGTEDNTNHQSAIEFRLINTVPIVPR